MLASSQTFNNHEVFSLKYFTVRSFHFNTSFFILLTDINECAGSNDCVANSECGNTDGSYTCTCSTGYTGNGKSSCSGRCLIYILSYICLISTICGINTVQDGGK